MIAQELYSIINALPHGATGVWPTLLPQQHAGFPAITYTLDEDTPSRLLDGVGTMSQARVSIDVWARSYAVAHTIADAVSVGMASVRGSYGALFLDQVRKEREVDLYESDTELFRVSLQFTIGYG